MQKQIWILGQVLELEVTSIISKVFSTRDAKLNWESNLSSVLLWTWFDLPQASAGYILDGCCSIFLINTDIYSSKHSPPKQNLRLLYFYYQTSFKKLLYTFKNSPLRPNLTDYLFIQELPWEKCLQLRWASPWISKKLYL